MTWLILAVLSASLLDAWTTHRVIEAGGYERNPLVRYILKHFGGAVWVGLKAVAGILVVVLSWPLLWPSLVAIGLLLAVSIWNWSLL